MGCFHVVYVSCVGGCESRVFHVPAIRSLDGCLFFVLCGALGGVWLLCIVACVVSVVVVVVLF